jgi:hypothetical protein
LAFVLSLSNNAKAQISGSLEGYYGKEKTMVAFTVDKKLNDLFHFGGILKTASLTVFNYPNFEYDYSEENSASNNTLLSDYPFPYGQYNGSFAGGSTRITGWSLGAYASLNKCLSRLKTDWFFVRFSTEYLFLKDQYDLRWSQMEFVGLERREKIIAEKGTYKFNAIAFASRAGYQRYFGKKDRFFAQANLGVSYYHPIYSDPNTSGYGTGTPFVGVEFEAGAGIGYVIKQY